MIYRHPTIGKVIVTKVIDIHIKQPSVVLESYKSDELLLLSAPVFDMLVDSNILERECSV